MVRGETQCEDSERRKARRVQGAPTSGWSAKQRGIWCSIAEDIGTLEHVKKAVQLVGKSTEKSSTLSPEVTEAVKKTALNSSRQEIKKREEEREGVIDRLVARRRELEGENSGISVKMVKELRDAAHCTTLQKLNDEFIDKWKDGFNTRGNVEAPAALMPQVESGISLRPEWDDERLLKEQTKVLKECSSRASRFTPEERGKIWNSLEAERELGFVEGPIAINAAEGPGQNDVHFLRFWREQEKHEVAGPTPKRKGRAIDDARLAGWNRATCVKSKLQLPGIDAYVDLLILLILTLISIWGVAMCPVVLLAKLDHKHAYRQFRVITTPLRRVIVCADKAGKNLYKWVAFRLLFGESSAPTWYNSVAFTLDLLTVSTLGIPLISYFDDFATAFPIFGAPEEEATKSSGVLSQVRRFLTEAIGTVFESSKCVAGQCIIYLGIEISVKGVVITVRLSDHRREKLKHIIQSALDSGHLFPSAASKLAGKLSWSACGLFGRVGRCFLYSVFARAYAKDGNTKIGKELEGSLRWWLKALEVSNFERRIDVGGFSSREKSWIIYTDASEFGLGGVAMYVVKGQVKNCKQFQIAVDHGQDTDIAISEGVAYRTALKGLAEENASNVIFVDNASLQGSLTKGRSKNATVNTLVGDSWLDACKKSLEVWVERVSSADNPADAPSRLQGCNKPLKGWLSAQGIHVQDVSKSCIEHARCIVRDLELGVVARL